MKRSVRRISPKQNRRDFLIKTGGALAAAGNRFAADPYARCGNRKHRRALSDDGKHGANRCGLRRSRQARGRDGQRCRRHQIARRCQAQPHRLGRAERHHRHPHGNRPFDLGQQTLRDSRLFCQRTDLDCQRSGGTRESADHHRLELRPAQQGSHSTSHAVRACLAVRQGAVANV